ncbi:MAG: bifunctional glycosyltransferase family 2/GtrA family protein [Sphaerochaetaceae bacterium]|jgi:glycosyltransferase involved in cell wall biosynthesis
MIPLIIPSYKPEEELLVLLDSLHDYSLGPIIVVNDGSGHEYDPIFEKAKDKAIILRHEENKGKGHALKTGFDYVLKEYPEALGVVTADSDGQHDASSIIEVVVALQNNCNSLVLGTRTFDSKDIPWKSRLGNKITIQIFKFASGVKINDTQTGLRGIPRLLMETMLDVKYDRFEFEMQMLFEATKEFKILEVPIETIYDSAEAHKTHFNHFIDSIRIYNVILKVFFKYFFSAVSSFVIDLLAFTLLCYILKGKTELYVLFSTIIARLISGTYNFFINFRFVFESQKTYMRPAIRYIILASVQMMLSALLTSIGVYFFPFIAEPVTKAIVDVILFFISFRIQHKYVF